MFLSKCFRWSGVLLLVPLLIMAGCGGGGGGESSAQSKSGTSPKTGTAETVTETAQTPGTETGGTTAQTPGTETGGTTAQTPGTETGGTTAQTPGTETGGTTAQTGGEFCPENLEFAGQIGANEERPHNGGTPSSENYTNDAGIAAVLAQLPGEGEETTGLSLPIVEATVTAVVSFGNRENRQFWIQDANAAIQLFLDESPDFGTVVVGQRISFTVNAIQNFFGTPQITQASDWTLVSDGNPVYIQDKTGEAIPIEMLGQIVRVTGAVIANNGNCGGSSTCYTLQHGEETITLRSSSEFIDLCECITFVGPVSQFNGTPQLDTVVFDWFIDSQPGEGEISACEGTGGTTGGTAGTTGGTAGTTGGTAGTTGGTTGGTENAYCPENLDFDGQIGSNPDNEHHGGTPTLTPYTNDAGIAAVLAAVPETPGEEVTGLSLEIDGATVTAVVAFRENRQFWIQDAGGAIQFFLDQAPDFGTVVVGQKISLTVNALLNFNGTPEITQASNWQVVSSENPVYIQDKTGEAIPIEMLGQIVRVTGVITEALGSCGGSSNCYTLTHGGETITFRTASAFTEVCDCITFVGPVGQFNGTTQLDAVDFDFDTTNETGPGNGEFPECEGAGTGTAGSSAGTSAETAASTSEPMVPVVVINEIMYDPAKVPDDRGEYVELFNTSDQEISITNWILATLDSEGQEVEHTISSVTPLTIPPKGFFVLGVNARPSRNGGVTVDYEYDPVISLSNTGGDAVILKDPDGVVVDRVDYELDAPWPLHKMGFAIELRDPYLDNDQGENWGNATQTYGDGDHGTPGSENAPE